MALDGLLKSIERGAVETAPKNGPRIKWETVLGWIIAALLAYAAVDRRVSVLESESRSVQEQLKEIRHDVKELLKR